MGLLYSYKYHYHLYLIKITYFSGGHLGLHLYKNAQGLASGTHQIWIQRVQIV